MKYVTLNDLRHNGKLYASGKTLELDDKTANPLVDCGAIAPASQEAKKAQAAKPAPEKKPKAKEKKAK